MAFLRNGFLPFLIRFFASTGMVVHPLFMHAYATFGAVHNGVSNDPVRPPVDLTGIFKVGLLTNAKTLKGHISVTFRPASKIFAFVDFPGLGLSIGTGFEKIWAGHDSLLSPKLVRILSDSVRCVHDKHSDTVVRYNYSCDHNWLPQNAFGTRSQFSICNCLTSILSSCQVT